MLFSLSFFTVFKEQEPTLVFYGHKGAIPAPIVRRNPCYSFGDFPGSIPQDPWAKISSFSSFSVFTLVFKNVLLDLFKSALFLVFCQCRSLCQAKPIQTNPTTSYYLPDLTLPHQKPLSEVGHSYQGKRCAQGALNPQIDTTSSQKLRLRLFLHSVRPPRSFLEKSRGPLVRFGQKCAACHTEVEFKFN